MRILRISRLLAPVAVLGALTLTACGGGEPLADLKGSGAAASVSPSPTATPSASASPVAVDPVMPGLAGRTVQGAREELAALSVSAERITTGSLHKDVVLPQAHAGWYVCETSPARGATLPAATGVVLKLAEKSADCSVSFHGFLHEKNDPAHTPQAPTPPPAATTAPAPAPTKAPERPQPPAPAPTKTKPPTGGGMTTCPDGKSGYACTSNGHPVVDGQFCPNADRGRTARATNGTTVTCSYDPSVKPYRWQ
ncbi:hypothetical protein ACQKM2_24745 [Streptomyces sp. NPDC004126]|uniref:hypothetical protein n=1 Tax=Streptomyces sp. NPDC004126 TaxID=3390695 RepID=UPI003D00BD2D